MASLLLRPAVALGALLVLAAAQAAEPFPTRPVRFIVPFAPGAANDLIARAVGSKLGELWNQSVVVDNRPGANTVIGSEIVARAPADGHTLLQTGLAHVVNPSVIRKLPYDSVRDFTALSLTGESPFVLVVGPQVQARSVRELVALARARPGVLAYGSTGAGGTSHLMGELLKSMARINMVHVPYKGSSGARTDIIGGQVDLMFDAVTTMTEQVKAGKVKALATSGRARSDVMPEVPTLSEAGVPGYEATIWLGLMAPRGTPQPVIDRLNETVSKIVGSPEVKQAWAKQGAAPMVMNPAAFTKYLNDDIAKWAGVIKTANIKLD